MTGISPRLLGLDLVVHQELHRASARAPASEYQATVTMTAESQKKYSDEIHNGGGVHYTLLLFWYTFWYTFLITAGGLGRGQRRVEIVEMTMVVDGNRAIVT